MGLSVRSFTHLSGPFETRFLKMKLAVCMHAISLNFQRYGGCIWTDWRWKERYYVQVRRFMQFKTGAQKGEKKAMKNVSKIGSKIAKLLNCEELCPEAVIKVRGIRTHVPNRGGSNFHYICIGGTLGSSLNQSNQNKKVQYRYTRTYMVGNPGLCNWRHRSKQNIIWRYLYRRIKVEKYAIAALRKIDAKM